jgi:TP901-1 family phage major tail protein
MPTFLLGKDARLYLGQPEDELSALSQVAYVRDVTVTMEAGEADVSTRASAWRGTMATQKDCSIEFEMLNKPGDAALAAVKSAFLEGTTVEIAALNQGRDLPGAEGPKGAFAIISFSRGEPLEDAQTISVTAKLAEFREWVEVTV